MHKVFLSSTARDLSAYREAVADAISSLDDFHCVRMEDFGARNAQADDFCRAKIAECAVAVFLAGLCYGSSPKGAKESYTHREYLAAKEAGTPRLVFLSELVKKLAKAVFYSPSLMKTDNGTRETTRTSDSRYFLKKTLNILIHNL